MESMKSQVKRWVYPAPVEDELVARLCKEINVSARLGGILVHRGIHTFEQAKKFFRPELSQLHDPFLMKDMEEAVGRIKTAIAEGQSILVYGDYDVDGTTSVAMMHSFLSEIHDKVKYYIPDRYKEGYGISDASVQWAHENKIDLIIALDCGIKAHPQVRKASALGIDYIICDHHNPDDDLPQAFAVLDPKRPDCDYPFKELSGCGVGFKLVQALAIRNNMPIEVVHNCLDLVALSIAADIVPIIGENRVLAYYGLKLLNAGPRPGLQFLISQAAINGDLNITNLVFKIAPKINASGRMAHASSALELLLADDAAVASGFAETLVSLNKERVDVDKSITEEAIEMIESSDASINAKSTVLYQSHWHKGVIGIVASRCTEVHYRPTIILTKSGDKVAGSARSVKGFDVYNAIEACGEYLEQFGGHKYAAGLTMLEENVDHFRKKFEEVVGATITDDQLVPSLSIDSEIEFDQITPNFFKVLQQVEPFGPANMNPIFVTKNVIAYTSTVVGEKHLKLTIGQPEGSKRFAAIGFGMGPQYEAVKDGKAFDVAYTIELNVYNGNSSIQLNLKDIKFEL